MRRAISLIVIVGALGVAAMARSESPEELAGPGFGAGSPLVVPAAAFSTKGNDADSHAFNVFFGFLAGTGVGDGCVQAPAYLPQGATVSYIYATVVDNDASNNLFINLDRRSNYDLNDVDSMALLQTSGQSTDIVTISDVTITSPDVRFPEYSYFLTTCLPSANTKLYSVRIYYQQPLFMDGFECGETWVWSSTGS